MLYELYIIYNLFLSSEYIYCFELYMERSYHKNILKTIILFFRILRRCI